MSVELTRRIAAKIMKRGESKIRISRAAVADAEKAITADDVRALIKGGKVYAVKMKHNISFRSTVVRKKKMQGRRRGRGSRKGTAGARLSVDYKKRVRGQRRILKRLKSTNKIDNQTYKRFYLLVKGGTFANKASLISHMKSTGIDISDDAAKELRHI
jgi:large subunit ribosomal protein L19e